MNIAIISSILTATIGLFGVLLGYILAKRWERNKLEISLIIDTLKPIMEWLKCVEKLIQIFADDYDFVVYREKQTSTYTLDDRRKSYQFIKENKNEVIGILNSQILQKQNIRKYAIELGENITNIENALYNKLLSIKFDTSTMADFERRRMEFIGQSTQVKIELDLLLQNSYKIINKMKDKSI
jgi:hypothetical protein